MAIIIPKTRPALTIVSNSYESPTHPWQELESCRGTIETAIKAVGRLESSDVSLPFLGTAFLIGNGLALTTRHVGETFASGHGDSSLSLKRDRTVWINFKAEFGSDEKDCATVTNVVFLHPYWDVAALKVETDRPGLQLDHNPPDMTGQSVVVIGYPAFDMRNDRELQQRIFGDLYNVKRLLPGKITGMKPVNSFSHEVTTLAYDATTLGGTAGGPVVDIHTGRVVGISFAGRYLESNYAVPSWQLMRDSRVRQHLDSKKEEPEWMSLWERATKDLSDATTLAAETFSVSPTVSPVQFFSHREVLELCGLLINAFPDDQGIAVLFNGLPPEFVASLPQGANTKEKLLNRLFAINRIGIVEDQHSPMHEMLSTAVYLRKLLPEHAHLLKYLTLVQSKEKLLK